ncbi:MAG: prepilin-type N-terminal cleavage/methylation domain-containing protein, partial [Betaproteobacteria bacterium]|nr:prepilin-type N-terminal cleavage/methylation domain-containing protein [Betaproteobacteria bacterium]
MKAKITALRGVTLVEIAIVLVIIGLLLGGILKGQELINNAKVRAIADRQNSMKVAWFSFIDRFQALPGDYV